MIGLAVERATSDSRSRDSLYEGIPRLHDLLTFHPSPPVHCSAANSRKLCQTTDARAIVGNTDSEGVCNQQTSPGRGRIDGNK